MILFFALTGALQAWDLHRSAKDGSYRAPWLVAVMSNFHQNKFFQGKAKATDGCSEIADPAEARRCREAGQKTVATNRFKGKISSVIIFLCACGLFLNAASGIWMAFDSKASRRAAAILVALGIAIPMLLIVI